jgi:DNA-binding NtrC family response regulator
MIQIDSMAAGEDLETQRQSGAAYGLGPSLADGFDVVVLEGPDAGARVALDGEATAKILVGTGPFCSPRLTDRAASRRHASLEVTDAGLLVTDLGSTNGTFVNDARVLAAILGPRDRLRLGSTVIQATPRSPALHPQTAVRAFGRVSSSSPRMLNALALCERLAKTDVPIVLEGETGTGKELVAECIHEASPRAAKPFVVLDCRTTPRDQVEAHLFGEVARDGAARPGIFDLANGGTLLLDEPADLAPEIQTKLLRALDKGVVARVGDPTPVKIDVRLLVATSQDLERLIEEGRFREDLYFRLAGARIELPPLRRRREDVPLLASQIWADLGGRNFVPAELLERFEGYDWPGNVRELERAIERFVALGDKASFAVQRTQHRAPGPAGRVAEPAAASADDALAKILAAKLGYSEARRRMLEEFERAYLEKALADNKGNVAAAAAASGIARRHFQRLRARQG